MPELRDYPLLLLVVVASSLYVTVEVGYRVAQRHGADQELHEQFAMARDQAGVLLSLLLGFTLAVAVGRYDLRWQEAVEEADAIGAARTRAELLPEPQHAEAKRLFAQYIQARIDFTAAGFDEEALEREQAKATALEKELWTHAVEAAQNSPTPIMALYVASLNQLTDAGTRRLAGLENRIPGLVWVMLGVLATFTSLMAGLSMRKRSIAAMLFPSLMVAIVAVLIAELDTPGRGLIRGDQRPIQQLKQE